MIRWRAGTVLEVRRAHPGLTDVVVEVDGRAEPAVAYDDLVGPLHPGARVLLNTTAVALGLGTGGVHFVIAVEDAPADTEARGRAMKLRYTPMQTSVDTVEETHAAEMGAIDSLGGMPVVVAGLHSALAPVAIGVRSVAPTARVAYVMTDGGALHLAFSRTVPALREAGLIDVTITTGQSTGGDLDAITLYSGLLAAKAIARADIAVVAMGPGNIGTASRYGFALMETAGIVNACATLDARAIVVPRISFADTRARHQGLSHHTLTAMGAALAPAEIVVPPLAPERARAVVEALRALDRHTVVEVPLGEAEGHLERSPVPLRSMGRSFAEDPDYFRTAAAAGVRAASLI